MSYSLTLTAKTLEELDAMIVNLVRSNAAGLAAASAPVAEPADKVVDLASEKKQRAAKGNGKTEKPEKTAKASPAAARDRDSEDAPDTDEMRERALKICRVLLESGDAGAKRDIKAMRDEFKVARLSEIAPEQTAEFLGKAIALQEAYSV